MQPKPYFCPGCGTGWAIDPRTVDRDPLASVATLVLGLRCSRCPGSAPIPKLLGLYALPPARRQGIASTDVRRWLKPTAVCKFFTMRYKAAHGPGDETRHARPPSGIKRLGSPDFHRFLAAWLMLRTLPPQHEEHTDLPGIGCDSASFKAQSKKNEHLPLYS
jgi:hypothetical protein